MQPKEYLTRLAAAVVKRSGICQATVEQVLPALFDEIRYQLCEGENHCVPIDSFGTFGIVEIPERLYHYTYKGLDEIRTLPPKKRLKFYPTRNMRREMEQGQFDSSRRSFRRHPDDPIIRKRLNIRYQPVKKGIYKGATQQIKKDNQ